MYEGVKPIEPYLGNPDYILNSGKILPPPEAVSRNKAFFQIMLHIHFMVFYIVLRSNDDVNPDLANYTIEYIERQKSLAPDKPFFVYYAPGMLLE